MHSNLFSGLITVGGLSNILLTSTCGIVLSSLTPISKKKQFTWLARFSCDIMLLSSSWIFEKSIIYDPTWQLVP